MQRYVLQQNEQKIKLKNQRDAENPEGRSALVSSRGSENHCSGLWKLKIIIRPHCLLALFFFFLLEIFLLRYTYSLQKKNGNINTGCIEGRAELLIGKES